LRNLMYCLLSAFSFYQRHSDHPDLHSFPTRRSSDLSQHLEASLGADRLPTALLQRSALTSFFGTLFPNYSTYMTPALSDAELKADRKSTRLNSSHLGISYAVFCLKKKKK